MSKVKTLGEILNHIREKKANGRNEAWFFNSHITKLDADALENDGYKVTASCVRGRPNFKVSW